MPPLSIKYVAGRGLLIVNVIATGVMLGVMQWSVFFLLQSYLASTAIVYLLATCVWLLGSLAGLAIPGRQEAVWLAGALASFYALRSLASAHPYELDYLPMLLPFVAGMGAYAGRFFRCRADAFSSTKWLFFLENTGFAAGMVLTAVALFWTGESFFGLGPAVATAVVLLTGANLLFTSPSEALK